MRYSGRRSSAPQNGSSGKTPASRSGAKSTAPDSTAWAAAPKTVPSTGQAKACCMRQERIFHWPSEAVYVCTSSNPLRAGEACRSVASVIALGARRTAVLRGYWLAFSCLESGGRSGVSARGRRRCGGRRGSGPTAWPARPARPRPSRGKLWSSRPASVTTATRGALVCDTAISSLLPARLRPPPLWCQRYKPRSVLVLLRDGCSGARRHDLTRWDPAARRDRCAGDGIYDRRATAEGAGNRLRLRLGLRRGGRGGFGAGGPELGEPAPGG